MTEIDMARYRQTARKRQNARLEALAHRRERAWSVARQAARLLKEQHDVSRVAVFGSLVNKTPFHVRSDVDLAVWGLDETVYYRVVSRLLDIDFAIEVDLIRVEDAPEFLRDAIEQEGVVL